MNEELDTIGFLTVQTVTANGALPVENAIVNIYEYGKEADTNAIYSLRTDASGKTDKVALDALSSSLSLTPEDKKPYTTYTLTVHRDGYYESEKVNIPIFQGITSLQTVNLIPLAEFSNPYSATPDFLGRYTRVPDSTL